MESLPTVIDGPVVAIGDVHGQTEKLLRLIDHLEQAGVLEQRAIVFLGDLVDRGPDSRGTIDLVLELLRDFPQATSVCGNHDLAMAAALGWIETPPIARWAFRWIDHYNSDATFRSYGVQSSNLNELDRAVPAPHRQLLSGLPWAVEHPDYLFVHAGLDPEIPWEDQLAALRQPDFSENRPRWLCSRKLATTPVPEDCPLTVVSGHVPVKNVFFDERRIRVDTTGGSQGELSAVLLPENRVFTSAGEQPAGQNRSPISTSNRPARTGSSGSGTN
ncbi:MAG: metallophosphoesterase [Planctomycetaceae bacterium]|nr:metallophosphoesterase [Planctomycetaceae bacterium]